MKESKKAVVKEKPNKRRNTNRRGKRGIQNNASGNKMKGKHTRNFHEEEEVGEGEIERRNQRKRRRKKRKPCKRRRRKVRVLPKRPESTRW